MITNSKPQELKELQTRLKKLEIEIQNKENLLVSLEKISSIGLFIGEITHELKNPLTAISGYIELARMAESIEEKMQYLDKVPGNINKMSQRLSQFRAMPGKTNAEFQSFDLNQVLAQCLSTLELLKPKGTDLYCSFSENSLMILGDEGQWFQVFLSVVRFFFKYMDTNNNELRIDTSILAADKILKSQSEIIIDCLGKQVWLNCLAKNSKWVKIKIENSKIKYSKRTIKNTLSGKISQNSVKDNSLLGLEIASDIVKRHSGNIVVGFPKGKGLNFEIYTPYELA